MGTLPTWDFGTKKAKHSIMTGTLTHQQAAAAAAAQGADPATIAAALGGTLRAGDVQCYMSATGGNPLADHLSECLSGKSEGGGWSSETLGKGGGNLGIRTLLSASVDV